MKAKTILICVLTLCLSSSIFGRAKKHETKVHFTAYDEKKKERDEAEKSRFSIAVKGGIGFPKMNELNDYIRSINKNWSGTIERIDKYWKYGIQGDVRLIEGLHIGVGYEGIRGTKATGTVTVPGPSVLNHKTEIKTHGVIAYLKNIWPELWGPFGLKASIGGGRHWSKYFEKEGDGDALTGKDKNWSFFLALGIVFDLGDNFGLSIDAMHQWLKFTNYKDSAGNVVTFLPPTDPDAKRAKVDFTGFSFSIEAIVRF